MRVESGYFLVLSRNPALPPEPQTHAQTTDGRGGASLYAAASQAEEQGLDAQEREDLKRIHWVKKTTAPKGWTGTSDGALQTMGPACALFEST